MVTDYDAKGVRAIRYKFVGPPKIISCGPKDSPKPNSNSEYGAFQVEVAPKPINLKQINDIINYPEEAINQNIEGRVTIKILVDTNGNVLKIGKLIGPAVFHKEVKTNIIKMKFNPAMIQGKPVKCWVSVPFNFKLGKGSAQGFSSNFITKVSNSVICKFEVTIYPRFFVKKAMSYSPRLSVGG